jgi:pSer/pThr/pTyr-binding forkhead associated (FHA) protein
MLEVVLTYSTDEGSREIALTEGKFSFGRGSEADYRLDDDGLSRLHATVYRDGDNVWITDENSTNGSFVNGEGVKPNGTILYDGDKIKIGNYTTMSVRIGAAQTAPAKNSAEKSRSVAASGADSHGFPMLIPFALAGLALLVIGISAAIIGYKVLGNNDIEIAEETPYQYDTPNDSDNKNDNKNSSKSPKPTASVSSSPIDGGNTETISNTTVETKTRRHAGSFAKGQISGYVGRRQEPLHRRQSGKGRAHHRQPEKRADSGGSRAGNQKIFERLCEPH